MNPKDKRLFISGGSRGIGLSNALKAAADGVNIVIAANVTEPHPRLEGTIHTAVKESDNAGGKALPLVCGIRSEERVNEVVAKAVQTFGGYGQLSSCP
nr:SDR family NAD(P)-dependent oxidoreductase [uncultured Hyphomonas sp.]